MAREKTDVRGDRPGADAAAALLAPQQSAEALLRSTLDALSAHIAVLDETGTIIAVNQAWRDFAAAGGYEGPDHAVGTNYLAVCESSAEASADAMRAADALREIMAGRRSAFRMEYVCASPEGPRWFELRVSCPLAAEARRVVVAHEDITHMKRAEETLARLNARLMRLQDDERRKIARELHDTTAQNLVAITLNATRLHDPRRCPPDQVGETAAEILELAEQSLREVRTLCYLVHPPLLDDVGLEAALRWLARGFGARSGIVVDERIEEIGAALSQDAATALFRVAQEALLNVTRHSGSAWARIGLRARHRSIELDIEDSGSGIGWIDARARGDEVEAVGVGISGMRVRLEQLGGRLELHARRPGLRVRGVLPLPARSAGGADPDA